jgi:tetratricopeptide (TPR) repeat protein
LLWPDQYDLQLADSVSLTDGISPEAQIRYSLTRRTKRTLFEIVDLLDEYVGEEVELTIGSCHSLDSGSSFFIEVLTQRSSRFKVRTTSDHAEYPIAALSPDEIRIAKHVVNGKIFDRDMLTYLTKKAWRFLRAGDAWGAATMLQLCPTNIISASAHQALAVAHVALNLTEDAERHYENWAASGSLLDSARAKYGLAMLYARHHPKHMQSNDRAAEYLNSAMSELDYLETLHPESDVVFDKVFNRNGYALIEFRRGKPDVAIKLLQDGYRQLDSRNERDHMHRSVLLYNMAQVNARSGNFENAIALYEDLLRVDPNMPEYHCELGLCHLKTDCFQAAIDQFSAALRLDPYIPETYAMLGYLYGKTGDSSLAIENYRLAWELDRSPTTAYSYAFHLTNAKNWQIAARVLNEFEIADVDASLRGSYSACMAEILLRTGNLSEAIAYLKSTRLLNPMDQRIQRNYDELLRIAARNTLSA